MPDAAAAAARGDIVFVVPPGRPPSGGDLYNRFLLRALGAEGFPVETTTLAGLVTGAYPPRTEFWVDSLYIRELAAADPFRPEDRVFFIIHSLPSVDPGISPGAAEKLRRAEDRLFARASGFLVTGPRTADALRERGFAAKAHPHRPAGPVCLAEGPARGPGRLHGAHRLEPHPRQGRSGFPGCPRPGSPGDRRLRRPHRRADGHRAARRPPSAWRPSAPILSSASASSTWDSSPTKSSAGNTSEARS